MEAKLPYCIPETDDIDICIENDFLASGTFTSDGVVDDESNETWF